MRDHFISELTKKAKKNKKIFLMVGDLGYNVVEQFADSYPDRFLNIGIAEQNMMGVAAGIASEGMHVFVYSIANFPTFRCAEQIRNDVDYHKLPVTIVSIGGGFSYGNLGYSHHAIQDYGLMRLMPNTLICAPGDLSETSKILQYLLKHPQPSYLRLDKSYNERIRSESFDVSPGKWICLQKKKTKKTFLTTGNTLKFYKEINKLKKYTNFNIYSLPMWGQNYKKKHSKMFQKFNHIITIEDHLLDGGFGSWIREAAGHNSNLKIENVGFNNKYLSSVGSQEYLNKKSGLFFA